MRVLFVALASALESTRFVAMVAFHRKGLALAESAAPRGVGRGIHGRGDGGVLQCRDRQRLARIHRGLVDVRGCAPAGVIQDNDASNGRGVGGVHVQTLGE